ncbi:hypothetical protein SDC9_118532 [bioreactor metagenome]|uniref:Uncharacterized protein n=1 Tax=bioreactor metagenome TaxID=1076179 RepID=A0A645C8Z4_9ZZZZ
MLQLRIHRKVDMIAAGAQLVFQGSAVCFGIQQISLHQQVGHHIPHAIFHKIRHFIKLVVGGLLNNGYGVV